MKKTFLISLIMLFASPVFAYQDYIIMTDKPVKFVYSENRNTAVVKPLYTIGNERNILILHCLAEGKAEIKVNFGDTQNVLKVKVNKKETKITPQKGFKYLPVDEPPFELEILEPPIFGGKL